MWRSLFPEALKKSLSILVSDTMTVSFPAVVASTSERRGSDKTGPLVRLLKLQHHLQREPHLSLAVSITGEPDRPNKCRQMLTSQGRNNTS